MLASPLNNLFGKKLRAVFAEHKKMILVINKILHWVWNPERFLIPLTHCNSSACSCNQYKETMLPHHFSLLPFFFLMEWNPLYSVLVMTHSTLLSLMILLQKPYVHHTANVTILRELMHSELKWPSHGHVASCWTNA